MSFLNTVMDLLVRKKQHISEPFYRLLTQGKSRLTLEFTISVVIRILKCKSNYGSNNLDSIILSSTKILLSKKISEMK
jgi:hypothetical protein